ncbi:MAG: HAMP domain-containing sensor histidine kinase [Clostridiales bacterium]
MKNNMRRKLLTFMAGLVALVVIFGWLINSLFLERFYLYSKGNSLLRSMTTINHLYNAGSPDIELELAKMQINQGIQVIIFNSNLEAVYMAWQDSINLGFGRRGILGGPDLPGFISKRSNLPFEISRNYDERLKTEYLDLVGSLDNGLYLLLRTPVQTITDSVGIANRFLLITGIFSILASAFISARLSNQIAKPIKAVEGIAKSMSHLDFTRKITVNTQDEIGSLAASINALSEHLQETIQELQEKNRQLEEDIQFISRLDEKRKEFLSSISHELKTPIALIQGYAEALEEKVVTSDEDRDYYYHVISDEADRMNALVKKLMNLNNLEAGQDELYLENFDIVSLVQSVMRRSKSLPGAEELDFRLLAPAEAWVRADEFLIEEVVLNYMTNAIHYADGRKLVQVTVKQLPAAAEQGEAAAEAAAGAAAEAGAGPNAGAATGTEAVPGSNAGPDSKAAPGSKAVSGKGAFGYDEDVMEGVILAAEGEEKQEEAAVAAAADASAASAAAAGANKENLSRRVRVEVFNSGSFLSEEERERVWESFYKADKSRSREYGGSGLGLTVVKAAMERHQSPFGVDNVEDGVSFWFELPQAQE